MVLLNSCVMFIISSIISCHSICSRVVSSRNRSPRSHPTYMNMKSKVGSVFACCVVKKTQAVTAVKKPWQPHHLTKKELTALSMNHTSYCSYERLEALASRSTRIMCNIYEENAVSFCVDRSGEEEPYALRLTPYALCVVKFFLTHINKPFLLQPFPLFPLKSFRFLKERHTPTLYTLSPPPPVFHVFCSLDSCIVLVRLAARTVGCLVPP